MQPETQRSHLSQTSAHPNQPPAQIQASSLNDSIQSFVMAVPVLIAIGILAYRRRRILALQQRILQLEKLWLLDGIRR